MVSLLRLPVRVQNRRHEPRVGVAAQHGTDRRRPSGPVRDHRRRHVQLGTGRRRQRYVATESFFFFFTDFPFLAVAGILVSFNRCHHRRLVTIFFSRSQLFLIGGILLHDVQLHRATPLGGNGPLDREPYIPGRRVVLRTTAAADGFDDNSLIGGREGPTANLPVKIAGGARNTFVAEFVPREVGTHTISVDYNGLPVTGTPFTCKVYDAAKVYVSAMPAGVLGKSLQFTGQSTILIRIVADER